MVKRSQEIVTKMKAVALQVEGGEANLVDTLRKVADIEKEKHLSFGLTERLLQLHPDNVEARFSLAFNYSNSNQNDSRFTTI